MQLVLLCTLLLLSSRGDVAAGPEGELCQGWTYDRESPVAAFQCPQSHDGADAQFCCGTCSLPYCCSSREARLDQWQCPRVGRQGARITDSPLTTQPPSDQGWNGMVVFIAMVAFCWFLCIAGLYCRGRCCRQPNKYMFDNMQTWAAIHWAARHRSLPPRIMGAPPSYMETYPGEIEATANLPPLLPAVHFQRAYPGNPEDECTLVPFEHRNVPDHASEPVLEAASSVDQRCPERERSASGASNAGESGISR